jgi:hypothetical protein
MNKISGTILLGLFSLVFLSISVKAQDTNPVQTSLSVGPSILEAVLDKGIATTKEVVLTNLSNLPQPIKTIKQSFTPKEKLEIDPKQLQIYDASSWITVSEADSDFILQPHQSKTIKLSLLQPDNASPGGHYATVIFQPLIPQELVSEGSVFVYTRVAVLVFLQTKGDISENLSIQDVLHRNIYEYSPLGFDVVIKNSGNTHLAPTGKLNVYNDITNQLIASQDLQSSIVLPGTEKTFHFEVPVGEHIGKYSSEAEVKYGTEDQILHSGRKSFVIFPYSIALLVGVPLLLVLILLLKFRTRMSKAYKVLFFDTEPVETIANVKKYIRTHINFSTEKTSKRKRK